MSTNKTCWEFWTFWLAIFKSFLTQTSTVIFFLFIDLWCGSGTFFVSFKLSSCCTWSIRPGKWWRSSHGSLSWSGKSYVWQHLVLFTIDIRFDGKKGIVSYDWTKKSCWTEPFSQLPDVKVDSYSKRFLCELTLRTMQKINKSRSIMNEH